MMFDVEFEEGQSTFEVEFEEVIEAGEEKYKQGKLEQYNQFWDVLQNNGSRNSYSHAFKFFSDETFKPKYKMNLAGDNTEMFDDSVIQSSDMLAEYVNFSKCEIGDRMFMDCEFITLPELDFGNAVSLNDLFSGSINIERIEKLILGSKLKYFNAPFFDLRKLSHIIIEGKIPNSVSFSESPLLDAESIQSIIDALEDVSDEGIVSPVCDAVTFSIDEDFDRCADGSYFANIATRQYKPHVAEGKYAGYGVIKPKYIVDPDADMSDRAISFGYRSDVTYDGNFRFILNPEHSHLMGEKADDKDLVVEFDFCIRGSSNKPNGYRFYIDEPLSQGYKSVARFLITSGSFVRFTSTNDIDMNNIAYIDGQAFNHLKVIVHKRSKRYSYYLNGKKIIDSSIFTFTDVNMVQILTFKVMHENNASVTDSRLYVDNLKMYVQDPAIESASKPRITFHPDIQLSDEQKAQIESKGWTI